MISFVHLFLFASIAWFAILILSDRKPPGDSDDA